MPIKRGAAPQPNRTAATAAAAIFFPFFFLIFYLLIKEEEEEPPPRQLNSALSRRRRRWRRRRKRRRRVEKEITSNKMLIILDWLWLGRAGSSAGSRRQWMLRTEKTFYLFICLVVLFSFCMCVCVRRLENRQGGPETSRKMNCIITKRVLWPRRGKRTAFSANTSHYCASRR